MLCSFICYMYNKLDSDNVSTPSLAYLYFLARRSKFILALPALTCLPLHHMASFDAAFKAGHADLVWMKFTADPRMTTNQFNKAWRDYVYKQRRAELFPGGSSREDPRMHPSVAHGLHGSSSGWTAEDNQLASFVGPFLKDAITQGLIEERRSKCLGPNSNGIDTFCGAFRIHAPENKSSNNTNYQKVVTFEFFLWSDVEPQPTFEYVKRKIAQTVDVNTADFFFETLAGKRLNANETMLTCYLRDKLMSSPAQDTINGQKLDTINGRKLVDIRMVVPFLDWTLAE